MWRWYKSLDARKYMLEQKTVIILIFIFIILIRRLTGFSTTFHWTCSVNRSEKLKVLMKQTLMMSSRALIKLINGLLDWLKWWSSLRSFGSFYSSRCFWSQPDNFDTSTGKPEEGKRWPLTPEPRRIKQYNKLFSLELLRQYSVDLYCSKCFYSVHVTMSFVIL